MILTPEKILFAAIALAAFLTLVAGEPAVRWERAHVPERPHWLPWMLLAMFAIASGVYGIAAPQEFGAALDQATMDPVSVAVALSQH